jgi:uncharacterized repeat protein (TIGR01451 family)
VHPSTRLSAAALAAGVLLAGPASVGAADLCQGLITDRLAHPMTPLPKPALGQVVIDPEFGTRIRRITAVPVVGQDPVIKPMYTTISAWNADESLLLLYRVGYTHQLYDGRTYAFIRNLNINPADVEQVYWHTSDPDILFYVDGNRLIRYHVSTSTPEVVRTFTFCTWASGGSDPMFTSWDSNRIGLQCNGQVFHYDIATDTVLGLRNSNSECPKSAPSGGLTYWNGAVTDAQLNVVRQLDLENPYEHASLGRLANGHDTYNGIAYEPGPAGSGVGSLVTHDLTNGVARVIVGPSTGYPYPPPGHVSALSYREPGWVTLSIGGTAGQTLLDNEILMADTNTGVVCRAAHHRSWGRDNTHLATPYWAEPHAVASPSGTRIVFGSDWGNSPSVDTYVVELPSYNSGPDVAASVGAAPNPAPLGNHMTYTATVANVGAGSATGVTLTVTLAPGIEVVSIPDPSACTVSGLDVVCTVGTLAAGGSRAFTVVVSAALGGTYLVRATAAADGDPNHANDTASLASAFHPGLRVGDLGILEGDSGERSLALPVSLSGPSRDTITVTYATADGTAQAGSDYRATAGTLTLPAGSTSGAVSVPVLGDAIVEPDETFELGLAAATNAWVEDGQGIGTILNDDAAPLPSLSVGDTTVREPRVGTRVARFVVTLSGAASQAVTVGYGTVDGTATAGSDYVAVSGSLTIPAGATSGSIGVTILADHVVDPRERFSLVLGGASGATIADGTGVCTIRR